MFGRINCNCTIVRLHFAAPPDHFIECVGELTSQWLKFWPSPASVDKPGLECSVEDPSEPFPARAIGQLAPTPAVAYGPKGPPLAAGEATSIGAWSAKACPAKEPMQRAINSKETRLFTLSEGLLRNYCSMTDGKIHTKPEE